MLVDAHIHQWDPYTTPRAASLAAKVIRRAPFASPLLWRMLPKTDREFVGDPHYVVRPYLLADYVADGAPVGVDTVVHIEAAWKTKRPRDAVEETRWIAGLPFGEHHAPVLGAIVAHADPTALDVAEVLDAHLAASPLVRGIRFLGAHSADPGVRSWTASAHVLSDRAFLKGFAHVAERGLSFDIWVYGHQLPDAMILAREYPETTFVLDHYATPVGVLGPRGKHTGITSAERKAILERWRDDLAALAAQPNVVAKHSGMGMPVLGLHPVPRTQLRDAIAPLVNHVEDMFGPQRTFWSSNFPIDKPNLMLADSVWVLRDVLAERIDEDAMFWANAARIYRLS